MTVVRWGWWIVTAGVILAPGCISQQAQMIEQDIAAVHDSLHVAMAAQERILDEIDSLNERLDEQEALLGEFRADHEADISELRGADSITETNVADDRDRLTLLAQRIDALERRIAGAALATRADTTHAMSPSEMVQAYDRAYLDFTRGKYDLAVLGFNEYLKNYPDTERADNAQYWIGECHYVQKDYETALAAFRKVLDEYPEGNKAPAALLKVGLTEASLGNESAAIRALKTVVERYPGTSEAEHARAKLLSLSE